ncbi:hypothetical protein C8F04DRAFT_1081064 [Mycena alexandri]|uniref:NAD(P)-binding protein n=1 Tax=Mycena alexandri TaxID=1745969 RepID=A0AAD6TAV6_9AGAR|nr:hypothetical protein C8F04DRAFT_1081064 [Mycena alexandri]
MSGPKGVAIVTGAAQGLGRAISVRLAEDGFDVAVNDVFSNSGKLETLVEEIQAKGRSSSKHIADVSQEEAVKKMVEEVVKTHGGLDVMVANAGVTGRPGVPFGQIPADEWDRVMGVNGRGTFLCYKYAGMQMVKQGRGGRIIGASSIAGKQGMMMQGPYCASKFAVRGLTQAAALEFGPHGITVNSYAPGAIDTPLLIAASVTGDPSEIIKKSIEKSAMKRIGVPDDISNLVSFLACKESQFITGQSVYNSATRTVSGPQTIIKHGVGPRDCRIYVDDRTFNICDHRRIVRSQAQPSVRLVSYYKQTLQPKNLCLVSCTGSLSLYKIVYLAFGHVV